MNLEKLNAQELFKPKEYLKTILKLIKLDIKQQKEYPDDKARIQAISLFKKLLPKNSWTLLPEIAYDLRYTLNHKECLQLLRFVTWMGINHKDEEVKNRRPLSIDMVRSSQYEFGLSIFLERIICESDYSEFFNFFHGNCFASILITSSGDREYYLNSAGEHFLMNANQFVKSNPKLKSDLTYDYDPNIKFSTREYI